MEKLKRKPLSSIFCADPKAQIYGGLWQEGHPA